MKKVQVLRVNVGKKSLRLIRPDVPDHEGTIYPKDVVKDIIDQINFRNPNNPLVVQLGAPADAYTIDPDNIIGWASNAHADIDGDVYVDLEFDTSFGNHSAADVIWLLENGHKAPRIAPVGFGNVEVDTVTHYKLTSVALFLK